MLDCSLYINELAHPIFTRWNKKFQILDWAKLHWFMMFFVLTISLHDGNSPWCAKMVFNLLLLRTISESLIWWFINKFEKKYDFSWWLTHSCKDSTLTRSLLVLECPTRKTMALSNSSFSYDSRLSFLDLLARSLEFPAGAVLLHLHFQRRIIKTGMHMFVNAPTIFVFIFISEEESVALRRRSLYTNFHFILLLPGKKKVKKEEERDEIVHCDRSQ